MRLSAGSNDLFASSSFDERSRYEKNYPNSVDRRRSINFWKEDALYGRANSRGEIIYPSEANLKQLHGTTQFALNFVVDAYEELKREMVGQAEAGNLPGLGGSPLESIFTPQRAWTSPHDLHTAHCQSFYDNKVLPYLLQPSVSPDILNFDNFVDAFTKVVESTSKLTPFTKSEFLKSKFSTPLISGLVIELSSEYDHGEDTPKITDFINNQNFEVYRALAFNYGFSVDRNAPWRLVALPGYPAMQPYMERYDGLNKDTIFEKYYYKASFFDIPTMRSFMFQYYQAFIRDNPTVHVPTMDLKPNERNFLTKTVSRATMTQGEYEDKYDSYFWIRLYIYLRAKELNKSWNQYKLDHVVKEASDFYTYATEDAVFKLIEKEMRQNVDEKFYPELRRGTFRFKRKQRYREESK